jgi:muramoyltetrapeptide carboxypeptidase
VNSPPYLRPGDTILLIATARKVSAGEMLPAITALQSWGLKVECGRHLYDQENQFAGSDVNRASDLQWALDHPQAKAIIIARGGYGTLRILDHVNLRKFREFPKWLIGYSDVTMLHGELFNAGFASLHATMPINFGKHEGATDSLRKALFGEKITYPIVAHPLNVAGTARGQVVGGNLSILCAIRGSSSEVDKKGRILFIEDLDEYLYHIDRLILQMKRAGQLKNLAALVVGGLNDMRDNPIPFGHTPEEIVLAAVKEYGYPVCFNFPCGHIAENYALYHGKPATLVVSSSGCSLNYS